jgi:hypothetical protein
MLVVYRYFKEIRNALAHSRAIATPYVIHAATPASTVTTNTVRMKRLPPVVRWALNDELTLDMRTVALFDALTRRVVLTLDAELACSPVGTRIVEERARAYCLGRNELPGDPAKKTRRLRRVLANVAAFGGPPSDLQPTPQELSSFEQFLRERRIVT